VRDGTVRRLSSLHKAVFKLTRGRVGGRLVDNDMLLLTTAGARTGRGHTVPLLFLGYDVSFVVIASYGGRDDHPQWYRNLRANPVASVQVGTRSTEVTARTASGEERSRLWRDVVRGYDQYRIYQSRTDREIPIVVLEPTVLPLAGGRTLRTPPGGRR
jgi:deazaflavin-dependent oxidoreductase (nitroreductase family)